MRLHETNNLQLLKDGHQKQACRSCRRLSCSGLTPLQMLYKRLCKKYTPESLTLTSIMCNRHFMPWFTAHFHLCSMLNVRVAFPSTSCYRGTKCSMSSAAKAWHLTGISSSLLWLTLFRWADVNSWSLSKTLISSSLPCVTTFVGASHGDGVHPQHKPQSAPKT